MKISGRSHRRDFRFSLISQTAEVWVKRVPDNNPGISAVLINKGVRGNEEEQGL